MRKKLLLLILILIKSLSFVLAENNNYKNELESTINNLNLKQKFELLRDNAKNPNNTDKALAAAELYLELADNNKVYDSLSKAYLYLGTVYWNKTSYKQAMDNFIQCIKYGEKYKDIPSQIAANIYIGLIYDRYFDYETRKKYVLSALKLSKDNNLIYETASAYWNLSHAFSFLKDYNKALIYADSSLYYLSKLRNQSNYDANFGYGLAYYYKGGAYNDLKKYDSAIYYFRLSMNLNFKINDFNLISHNASEIAKNFNFLKKYDSVLVYAKLCEQYAVKSTNLFTQSLGYEESAKAYEGLGDLKNAYYFLKKYKTIKDTLIKKEALDAAAKYEVNRLEESKRNEVLKYENEIKLEKNTKYFAFLIFAILAVAALAIIIILVNRNRLKNKYNEELLKLNAVKDKFFAIISHDLKSPIASFYSMAQLLNDFYTRIAEEDKRKHLKTLKDSSGQILKLLDNLLMWASVQTGDIQIKYENLDVKTLIDEAIKNHNSAAKLKQITLNYSGPEELKIDADVNMLQTVIRNLISNALKFSYEGGKIDVSLSEENGNAKVRIQDYGLGIKYEDKAKIFSLDSKLSRFGTAGEKGTGLGLNLCKEFVERHGGEISFESELEKGSTFEFLIPINQILH